MKPQCHDCGKTMELESVHMGFNSIYKTYKCECGKRTACLLTWEGEEWTETWFEEVM